jgi:nucleoside-diphosphate-sugar epimerase
MGQLRGRRIVVTGGAGFLGRAVCEELSRYSPERIVIPRSREHDLRDMGAIRQLLTASNPHVVIHLAAVVGGIGANRRNPGRYFYDNAIMGIQLLEAARRYGVAKYVQVGTICSYPKHTPVPFREDDLWSGYPEETNAPYGLAKKMLLVQAQAYRQQYGINAVTLLPVNLYGPHDNFDLQSSHVIPALIRKVLDARDAGLDSVEAWGTGRASREFLYVRDAARGIVMAADRYDEPDPVNLGAGQEITIRELSERIAELCSYHGHFQWNKNQPDGQPRRCLDTTRARDKFGFQATTSLNDGLRETIRWYEEQREAERRRSAA